MFGGPNFAQMVEQRFWTYDTIGNLLSFRHAYPAQGNGTGFFHTGALLDGATIDSRADFNSLSATNMTSTNYRGDGVSYFVVGKTGPNAAPVSSGMKTRGSFYPGLKSSSSSYGNVGSFDPFSGFGSITAFVRGILGGSGGGGYSGPYGETTVNYTYGENGAGPHAVTSRSNGDSFTYDGNGNMTQRVQNSVTWTQTFDAENRLVSVSDGTTTTQYVYDGSGNRVKRIVGNTTTLYVAGMEIEQVSGVESQRTIYYPAGGAFRVIVASPASNTVYYRHGDHLGSTSVLSDSTGVKVTGSEVVYAPFGVVRTGSESNLTDFGYTGQRHDDSTGGLMYYGARYYLPGVARFISADTIVPGMFNPQALNRYSYVTNRPINFNDPTGHTLNQPMIDGYYSTDYVVNPKKEKPLPECPGGCQTNFTGQVVVLPNSNSSAATEVQTAVTSGGGIVAKGSEALFSCCQDGNFDEEEIKKIEILGNADYVTLSGTAPLFGPIGGPALGITIDAYGNVYLSLGFGLGPGASLDAGWRFENGGWEFFSGSENDLQKTLTGLAVVGGGGYIAGADALLTNPGGVEVGLHTPGANVTVTHTILLIDANYALKAPPYPPGSDPIIAPSATTPEEEDWWVIEFLNKIQNPPTLTLPPYP